MDGFFHQKWHLYLSLTLTCARHHSNVHSPEKEATSSILPGYQVHKVVLMLGITSHLPHRGPCPIFQSRPQVLSVSHGPLPGSHFSTLLYPFLVTSSNRSLLPQFQARLLGSGNAYRMNNCRIIKSLDGSRHSERSTSELGVRPPREFSFLPASLICIYHEYSTVSVGPHLHLLSDLFSINRMLTLKGSAYYLPSTLSGTGNPSVLNGLNGWMDE